MNAAAWILFILGTLLATATGAHDPPMWVPFGVGIGLAVSGALLLRRQNADAIGASDGQTGIRDLSGLRAALGTLTTDTAALASSPSDPEAVRPTLESLLLEQVLPLVDARGFLSNAHGVEAYARVFTPFASAERCLNRAWSALADGNHHEATAQLQKAHQHFLAAEQGWPSA